MEPPPSYESIVPQNSSKRESNQKKKSSRTGVAPFVRQIPKFEGENPFKNVKFPMITALELSQTTEQNYFQTLLSVNHGFQDIHDAQEPAFNPDDILRNP